MTRRTGTFCFTDIEGSTRRWEQDRPGMERDLAEHDRLVRELAARYGGSVFAHTGDGVGVAFEDVEQSIPFAVDLQRGITALPIRVAIHAGSAEERDGNWFGPTLNRCARLCAAGHGGQILVSGAVAAMVQATLPEDVHLRSLGTHRLKDLREPEAVWQLGTVGLKTDFPALRSLSPPLHNLPIETSSFLGRALELSQVTGALSGNRLVTLAGPGGMGKTRLALQVAIKQIDAFPHGVWFVDLAPIGEGADVADGVLRVLDVQRQPGADASEKVADSLVDRDLLLVLDNCEHVIEAASGLTSRILGRCPKVRLLATSREPLGLPEETVVAVPALGDVAVDLFMARAVSAGADVTDDDRETVAQICERLDGMPLAVELAAARAASLSPADIVRHLDDPLLLLAARRPADRRRHSSVRATLEWSVALLTDAERDLFDRLSVFASGFTLDAAEAINPHGSTLDVVAALVAKSMVSAVRTADGSVRYRLLEMMRGLGAEHLSERGLSRDVHADHAAWCAAFCASMRSGLATTDEPAWLDRLEIEFDNLRVAMSWCLAEGDLLAVDIVGSLADLAFHKLSSEVWDWAEAALAIPGASEEILAIETQFLAANRCMRTRDWDAALGHVNKIGVLGASSGRPSAFWTETIRHHVLTMSGSGVAMEPYSLEARHTAPAGWSGWIAWIDTIGPFWGLEVDWAELIDRMGAIERSGNVTSRALVAQARSYAAFHGGPPGDAPALNQQALDLARRVRHELAIGHALNLRFLICIRNGDVIGALEVADEVLDHWARSPDELQGPNAAGDHAPLLVALGRPELAVVRDSFGEPIHIATWAETLAKATSALGPARSAELAAMGSSMTWPEFRVFAQGELRLAAAALAQAEGHDVNVSDVLAAYRVPAPRAATPARGARRRG